MSMPILETLESKKGVRRNFAEEHGKTADAAWPLLPAAPRERREPLRPI